MVKQGLPGYPALIAKESVTYALYFPIYESLQTGSAFLNGALAGSISWSLCYPLDTIKVYKQTHKPLSEIRSVKQLYRGLTLQVLRVFPMTGIGMCTFEWVRKHL